MGIKLKMRGGDGASCLVMLCVYFAIWMICGLIGGLLWPYSLNSWLHHFGKPESITFLHGFGLGLIPGVGQLTVPAAIITWILMLFMAN